MDLTTRVRAPAEVMATEIDGEAVLMHVSSGVYYGLNEVGALIWRRMAGDVSVADLCEAVLEEYEVPRDVCRRDVVTLLEQMAEAGLVDVAPTKD